MTVRFALSEHGRSFATRGRAADLRQELEVLIGNEPIAIVDFDGVSNVTYSFADELLGKVAATGDVRIEPINMAAPVADTVTRALANRTQPATTR